MSPPHRVSASATARRSLCEVKPAWRLNAAQAAMSFTHCRLAYGRAGKKSFRRASVYLSPMGNGRIRRGAAASGSRSFGRGAVMNRGAFVEEMSAAQLSAGHGHTRQLLRASKGYERAAIEGFVDVE